MRHLDANILIAWHRADHPHHHAVKKWCDALLSTDEPFGALDLAWTTFLRISTNPRAFLVPSSLADALGFRSSIRLQTNHVDVATGPRHWDITERLCRDHRVTGNLVNDAYLAAAAIEQGAGLVSLDGDFGRFRGLTWIDPANP